MSMKRILNKFGVSWHDVFIVILLFETCWWGMYAFMDGADFVIRTIIETDKTEYHVFVLVQKCISVLKLSLTIICLWYGAIFLGKGIFVRTYLILGVVIDTVLILSWIAISIEESWPLSPVNNFGIHYVVTFVLFRSIVYFFIYDFIGNIFVSPFGPPVVGTMNGIVIGIPEHGSGVTLNHGSNLAFLGKGLKATLEYYRTAAEQAFLVAVIWDTFWNVAVMFSQELPELLFNYVFIGTFGSLPLNISTDDVVLRFIRIILGLIAIYLVMKKNQLFIKIWIGLYALVMLTNAGLLAYLASTVLVEETATASVIMCGVFFLSNAAKIFVLYCSLRFYFHLRKSEVCLINENNNDA